MLFDKLLKELEPAQKIILACVGIGIVLILVMPFLVPAHVTTPITTLPAEPMTPIEVDDSSSSDNPWIDWAKPDHWMVIVSPLIVDSKEHMSVEQIMANSKPVAPNTLIYVPTSVKKVKVVMGGSENTPKHTAIVSYNVQKETVPWIVTGIGKDNEWDMIGGFAQNVGGTTDTIYGEILASYYPTATPPSVYDKVICWFNHGYTPAHVAYI
jgi:hypothetical protein